MTTTPPPALPVSFVDDPQMAETFASGVSGFFVLGGNVVITFESARIDHSSSPGPVNRVVCARIVMPIGVAQGLAVGLHDFLTKQGFDPTAALTAGETQQ